ncbi:MAG TPA: sigma factor, partial [Streptosporangiaceae bacterium]
MLRAWTHRDSLDTQHVHPGAWLITVARRLAVDAHRARRARPKKSSWRSTLPPPVAAGAHPNDQDIRSDRQQHQATSQPQ